MGTVSELGKALLLLGGGLALLGVLLIAVGRVPFLGQLPGDVTLRRGNFTCFVPIVSSLLLSIVLSLLLNLVLRLLHR